MIVRDEEKTLGRCLRSVEGIPDEIIIVDTGSHDSTKEIAGEFRSRVVDFEWVDDFSAARNYSFEQATMDYILWLDADDVLLPRDRTKLLELKNTLDPGIDAVSMTYHADFDDSNNVIQSLRYLRLVRRSAHFTWAGFVHENLVVDDAVHHLDSDIVVTHVKDWAESRSSRRNLLIYEKHFARGGEQRPVDIFNYARELEHHKEFAKAIPYFRQFLDTNEADLEQALLTLNSLATCYYQVGDLDKEWECTLKSIELDIPRSEFSCRFAEHFLRRNQYHQAIFWYQLALQNPGIGVNSWSNQYGPFSTWLPHKQLALCYYKIGDYQRSLQHNEAARTYLPNDAEIDTNIGFLKKLLNESADNGDTAEGVRVSETG